MLHFESVTWPLPIPRFPGAEAISSASAVIAASAAVVGLEPVASAPPVVTARTVTWRIRRVASWFPARVHSVRKESSGCCTGQIQSQAAAHPPFPWEEAISSASAVIAASAAVVELEPVASSSSVVSTAATVVSEPSFVSSTDAEFHQWCPQRTDSSPGGPRARSGFCGAEHPVDLADVGPFPSASTRTLPSAGEGPVNGTNRPPSGVAPRCRRTQPSPCVVRFRGPFQRAGGRGPLERRLRAAAMRQSTPKAAPGRGCLVPLVFRGNEAGSGSFRNVHDEVRLDVPPEASSAVTVISYTSTPCCSCNRSNVRFPRHAVRERQRTMRAQAPRRVTASPSGSSSPATMMLVPSAFMVPFDPSNLVSGSALVGCWAIRTEVDACLAGQPSSSCGAIFPRNPGRSPCVP